MLTSREQVAALKDGRIDLDFGRIPHGDPMIHEVKERQAALRLVAAETGFAIVPASVERLRRDNGVYAPLDEPEASSPVIISIRKDDPSPELVLILRLIKRMYRDRGPTFGR